MDKDRLEDPLFRIHSLEQRTGKHMSDVQADKFNNEFYRQYYGEDDKENNNGNYEFDDDELMEYCLLSPKDTGLPMECYADDGGSWKGRNHPLWFLMVNGYGDEPEVVPFTVCNNPQIVGNYNIKVRQNDVDNVRSFIIQNLNGIISLGNGEINSGVFEDNMDTFQYRMAEGKERIDEMSKLGPDETNLPTEIRVDEGERFANQIQNRT